MKTKVDRLFLSAAQVVPLTDGPPTGARRGAALRQVRALNDGAIAVRAGRVVEVGPTAQLSTRYQADEEVDLRGLVVLPGFVDPHTHPVFVDTREDEFHRRIAGESYVAIAEAGGGILSSVRGVRSVSEDQLLDRTRARFDRFLRLGTTTIEAKSGYGLTLDDELKSLRVLARLRRSHPLTVSPTFLGAHAVPAEHREDPDRYVALLIDTMLPAVKDLADSCDVFAEPGFFDLQRSERILAAARAAGFRLRVHADEIEWMGGAELAARLDADSADHLIRIGDAGIQALAAARTVAVLLPGTSFLLGKPPAPARRMIEAGCAIALATDFNPGTCYTQSMHAVLSLACVALRLSPEEALTASTINAAASLRLDLELGTLHAGKRADFQVLELPSWRAVGYAFADNPVVMTIKDGRPVAVNSCSYEADL
jgi:imidazolonepropionase